MVCGAGAVRTATLDTLEDMPTEHVTAALHYLTEGDDPHSTPLVYVPGGLGSAEH